MFILDEKKNAKYLSIGIAIVTLFVFTGQVSDPVNAPKFLVLGLVASCGAVILFLPNLKYIISNYRTPLTISLLTILVSIFAAGKSESPFSQNLYGVQGRNTGVLTHISLVMLFLSVLSFKNLKNLKLIFYGFLASGFMNILYCLWTLIFGDFIQWNNTYKALLGTLGNPNFISALLGLTLVGSVGFFLASDLNFKKFCIVSLLCLVTIFEILKTNSTQGLVIVGIGLYLVLLIILILNRSRFFWILFVYITAGGVLAVMGGLAFVNKGPLSGIVYQETLGYRIQYWRAGLKMGLKFPYSGVGMDSYGDWYRQLRTPESLVSPGVGVITNVSHNVFIDAFASGGFPLLICYLFFLILPLIAVIKVLKRNKKIDSFFVALAATWICYQIQSFISINQIGLAVWGWTLSGLLIAYESATRFNEKDTENRNYINKKSQLKSSPFVPISLLISISIGLIVYSPPMLADHKWTRAYLARNADQLYLAMEDSYFNPSNSYNYLQTIQLFDRNGFSERAHDLTIRAISFNPRNFESWQMLYYIKGANDFERAKAVSMMIKLDPRNIELKQLQK